jgi:hypothetical protein
LNAIQALSQLSYSPETDETKFNIEQERLSIHPWFLNWFFNITKNFPFLHPIDEGSYDSPSSSQNFHLKFDIRGAFSYRKFCAGVVKLVDARDSKSREPQAHVGSIPTSGTNFDQFKPPVFVLFHSSI